MSDWSRGKAWTVALRTCLPSHRVHIFNLRTFPTVETSGVTLLGVYVFLCSMLECIISTFIVLCIYV